MRAVVQRVRQASVRIDTETIAAIGRGLVILLGVKEGDGNEEAEYLAHKIARLRIFPDRHGRFNLSALDVGAEALVVSQFTLYGDTRRGRRPSFTQAADPEIAEPLIQHFVEEMVAAGVPASTGRFGAHMLVEIHNDGPVTIIMER